MAGSGKAKLLAGLGSLNQSVENIYNRKRQKLLDALAEEEIRSRIAERAAQAETEREYREGQIREASQTRQNKTREALLKSQTKLMEGIQRGRVAKNLEAGDVKKAQRISYNRLGEYVPEHIGKLFGPEDVTEKELTPFRLWLRDNPDGTYEEYIRAGTRPTAGGVGEPDLIDQVESAASKLAAREGELPIVSPERRAEASRVVRGADNLPYPKAEVRDEFSEMSSGEWETIVFAAIEDAGGLVPEGLADTLLDAEPRDRKALFAAIPKMVRAPSRR